MQRVFVSLTINCESEGNGKREWSDIPDRTWKAFETTVYAGDGLVVATM